MRACLDLSDEEWFNLHTQSEPLEVDDSTSGDDDGDGEDIEDGKDGEENQ